MSKILIIGASSGIGKSLSESLNKDNHEVYVTYRNNEPTKNKESQKWDAGSDEEIDIIPDELDGLVYCPGTINLKPFHRIKIEDFEDELNVNFIGAVKAIQSALPYLKKSGNASVVLFSTVAVQNGMPFHSGVASAKGAIEGLTRSLAAELAPKIRVNCIAPSITDTPLAEKILSNDDKKKNSAERHPLKRVGETEDIVNAIEFLLSNKSSWISGEILHVDGGMNAIRPL